MKQEHKFGLDFGTSTTLLSFQNTPDEPVTNLTFAGENGELSPYLPSRVGVYEGAIVAGFRASTLRSQVQLKTVSPKAYLYSFSNNLENVSADVLGALEVLPGLTLFDAVKAVFQEVVQLGGKSKDAPNFSTDEFTVGCPSNWSLVQRTLMVSAAKSAGIRKVKLVDSLEEPVAAGWYLLGADAASKDRKVLVVDSGGGTTDVALIDVKNGTFNLLASDSTPQAGEAADELIKDMLVAKFKKADKTFLIDQLDPSITNWLLDEAEALKVEASKRTGELPFVFPGWTSRFISSDILNTVSSIDVTEVLNAYDPVVRSIANLVDDVLFRGTLTAANSEELEKALKSLPGRESKLNYGSERGDWEADDRRPESAALQSMRREWAALQELLKQSIDLVVLSGGMARSPRLVKLVSKALPKASLATEQDSAAGAFDAQLLVSQGLALQQPPKTLNIHRLPLSLYLEWSEAAPGSPTVHNQKVCLMQAFDSCAPDEVFSDYAQVSHFGQYAELQIASGVKVVTEGASPRLVAYAPEVGKDFKADLKPVPLGVTSSDTAKSAQARATQRSVVDSIAVELHSGQPLRFKRYASGAIGLRDSDGNLLMCVPRTEYGQGTLEVQVILGDSSRWMAEAKVN